MDIGRKGRLTVFGVVVASFVAACSGVVLLLALLVLRQDPPQE